MAQSVEARFWAKVKKTDGCWEWGAYRNGGGYGSFRIDSRRSSPTRGMALAHRVAWELTNGPVPDGMDILHSCHNRGCVNPAHLRPGTDTENAHDRVLAGRSSAKLTPDDIRRIRRRCELGEFQRVIAADFGVSQMTISHIHRRVTWGHVA